METDIIKNFKDNLIENGRFGKNLLHSKTKLTCVSVGCVGNLAFAMNHLYFLKGECESIYIDFMKKEFCEWENKLNPYDEILNQKITDEYKEVFCFGNELHDYDEIILQDIRNEVKPFFNFRKVLTHQVDSFCEEHEISLGTVGVHVRMSDMNAWHGTQFGYVYYTDYVNKMDYLLNNHPINNFFIASDNQETLDKLIKRYGGIIHYHKNVYRTEHEHEYGLEEDLRKKCYEKLTGFYNFYTPFLDLLTLSRCGYFIGRKFSNFSLAATVLGDMPFNRIINLYNE